MRRDKMRGQLYLASTECVRILRLELNEASVRAQHPANTDTGTSEDRSRQALAQNNLDRPVSLASPGQRLGAVESGLVQQHWHWVRDYDNKTRETSRVPVRS